MAEVWVPLSKNQIIIAGPGKSSWAKNVIGDLNWLKENLDAFGYINSLFDQFGGDGSDGDRTDASNTTLAIGSGKQYEDWTINTGVTVTLTGDSLGKARVGVSGRLTIVGGLSMLGTGTIGGTASGGNSHYTSQGIGMPTGGGGGSGSASTASTSQAGGYSGVLSRITSGGAGVATAAGNVGGAGSAWTGVADLLKDVLHLQSGPGGGAGGYGNHSGGSFPAGGAGGPSGGCLVIECSELDFQAGGAINVSGGPGNGGSVLFTAGGGGGGGGAGGIVVILAKSIIANAGTVTANGGAGGAGGIGSSYTGGAGGAGGAGTYLIAEVA